MNTLFFCSFAMKVNTSLLEARGRYGTLRAFIRHITSVNCIRFFTFEEWIPRFTLIQVYLVINRSKYSAC